VGERGQKGIEAGGRLRPLEAADDLHDRDGGELVAAERPAVDLRVSRNDSVFPLADLGENVGVK
jgi:hypothetical protein